MKKLMFGLAAIAATAAFADGIESENVVGYTSKAAEANLNWYAPQFYAVGYTTIDINSIQLNDGNAGTVGWGDSMQIVGPLGSAIAFYSYWDPSMDPAGEATTLYWGDENGTPVEISFDAGDGIAIDNAAELGYSIQNSGEVVSADVSFEASSNLNWTGNPFPTSITLNNIVLDDDNTGVVGWGDSMQIVGPLGSATGFYSYWDPSMDPNGTATERYWGDDNGEPAELTLEPGAGFAIDNAAELEFKIKIVCPYK